VGRGAEDADRGAEHRGAGEQHQNQLSPPKRSACSPTAYPTPWRTGAEGVRLTLALCWATPIETDGLEGVTRPSRSASRSTESPRPAGAGGDQGPSRSLNTRGYQRDLNEGVGDRVTEVAVCVSAQRTGSATSEAQNTTPATPVAGRLMSFVSPASRRDAGNARATGPTGRRRPMMTELECSLAPSSHAAPNFQVPFCQVVPRSRRGPEGEEVLVPANARLPHVPGARSPWSRRV